MDKKLKNLSVEIMGFFQPRISISCYLQYKRTIWICISNTFTGTVFVIIFRHHMSPLEMKHMHKHVT